MTDEDLIRTLEAHGLRLTSHVGERREWSNGSFSVVNDFHGLRWRLYQHNSYGPSMTKDELAEWFAAIDSACEEAK
ncbi:MAG: hypothetical protein IJS15_01410 [Victivallales bacterium]|nr:hypothetical protein [Victivallales bacterium]